LAVGERPGKDEQRLGAVFVGKTGRELDETYLPLAGLDRSDIRVCNAVRCWADNNRTPTEKEVVLCAAHHLPQEIEETAPELVILMGSSACRLVPQIKLDMMHGIPQRVDDLFGWSGWVVPMYHPAMGLHESRWMTQLLEDWERLKGWIGGERTEQTSVESTCYVQAVDVHRYLDCIEACLDMAVDTEDHGGVPWSVQLSHTAGTGVLVRTDDQSNMGILRQWFPATSAEFIFHNAPHDLDVLAKVGMYPQRYRDTMQEAFHLGNLPQGLKPLTYRLFGITMTSWEDVVRPASIRALENWMVEALVVAEADLHYAEHKHLKTKTKTIVKAGELEKLLKRMMSHTDAASDYDPWQRLDDFWRDEANEWQTAYVEARCGRYPILGIGNCRLEDAVRYGCSDADFTGRVAVELEKRRRDAYWTIAEGDEDA
jgi:uracil-DNA glycosylase family 4